MISSFSSGASALTCSYVVLLCLIVRSSANVFYEKYVINRCDIAPIFDIRIPENVLNSFSLSSSNRRPDGKISTEMDRFCRSPTGYYLNLTAK
jgi:hypothetical protein